MIRYFIFTLLGREVQWGTTRGCVGLQGPALQQQPVGTVDGLLDRCPFRSGDCLRRVQKSLERVLHLRGEPVVFVRRMLGSIIRKNIPKKTRNIVTKNWRLLKTLFLLKYWLCAHSSHNDNFSAFYFGEISGCLHCLQFFRKFYNQTFFQKPRGKKIYWSFSRGFPILDCDRRDRS